MVESVGHVVYAYERSVYLEKRERELVVVVCKYREQE